MFEKGALLYPVRRSLHAPQTRVTRQVRCQGCEAGFSVRSASKGIGLPAAQLGTPAGDAHTDTGRASAATDAAVRGGRLAATAPCESRPSAPATRVSSMSVAELQDALKVHAAPFESPCTRPRAPLDVCSPIAREPGHVKHTGIAQWGSEIHLPWPRFSDPAACRTRWSATAGCASCRLRRARRRTDCWQALNRQRCASCLPGTRASRAVAVAATAVRACHRDAAAFGAARATPGRRHTGRRPRGRGRSCCDDSRPEWQWDRRPPHPVQGAVQPEPTS